RGCAACGSSVAGYMPSPVVQGGRARCRRAAPGWEAWHELEGGVGLRRTTLWFERPRDHGGGGGFLRRRSGGSFAAVEGDRAAASAPLRVLQVPGRLVPEEPLREPAR